MSFDLGPPRRLAYLTTSLIPSLFSLIPHDKPTPILNAPCLPPPPAISAGRRPGAAPSVCCPAAAPAARDCAPSTRARAGSACRRAAGGRRGTGCRRGARRGGPTAAASCAATCRSRAPDTASLRAAREVR